MNRISALAGVVMLCASIVWAAQRGEPTSGDTIESGRETVIFHCAPCHGRDGRGDGPIVAALKMRPPDLTTMSRRNGGKFRRADVASFVTGERRFPAAHGSNDMPVWGPLFRQMNPFDSRIDIRLNRLIDHLESIQAR